MHSVKTHNCSGQLVICSETLKSRQIHNAVNICRLDEKTETFQHRHHKCFYMLCLWAKRNLFKAWGVKGRFTVVSDLESHSHTKWRNSAQSWHPQWQQHWEPQKLSHQSLVTCQTVSLLSDALTLQERERENKNSWDSINVSNLVSNFSEGLQNLYFTTLKLQGQCQAPDPCSWSIHTHTHTSAYETNSGTVSCWWGSNPNVSRLINDSALLCIGLQKQRGEEKKNRAKLLELSKPLTVNKALSVTGAETKNQKQFSSSLLVDSRHPWIPQET